MQTLLLKHSAHICNADYYTKTGKCPKNCEKKAKPKMHFNGKALKDVSILQIEKNLPVKNNIIVSFGLF